MLARSFAFLFEFWHRTISPGLPSACRFEPSCSIYSAQALRKHGFWRGSWLALKRLLSCHPWHRGGFDPVP